MIFNTEVERSLEEAVVVGEAGVHTFINRTLSKREIDIFIAELVDRYGAHAIASVLDTIKSLAFKYATQAGITISKNDIVIPPEKEEILAGYEAKVKVVEGNYERGLITEDERHEQIVNIWTEATDTVADAMQANLNELNSIYMMANSGARGSFKQIRQLAGMRGLMANPKGEIIERPIKANFMEGLSVLEYFISTHGARKGLADTALRTADSGYLTRRLVDVSQDVIIREADCGTEEFVELPIHLPEGLNKSVMGRILAEDVRKPLASGKPGKTVVAEKGESITAPRLREIAEALEDDERDAAGALGAEVPRRDRRVPDLLRHLPRDGQRLRHRRRGRHHRRAVDRRAGHAADDADVPHRRCRRRGHHARPAACRRDLRGAEPEGRRDARGGRRPRRDRGGRPDREDHDRAGRARRERRADSGEGVLAPAALAAARHAGPGDRAGRPLNEGSRAPAELLDLHAKAGKGSTETELYLVGEVQKVYKSQGVDIHDKHIELIVRQMLKKVRVMEAGDTSLLPGELADKTKLERENAKLKKKDEQATFEPLILGITKASLATESFLSAASFQETTKVLTDASIEGKVDHLLGLKENVIIGKLIPAATGLKRYRQIGIGPSDSVPAHLYARPETEAELLAALEEIGGDGDGLDLEALGLTFGGTPGSDEASSHDAGEATEVPEVDSPLDEEK